MSAGLSVSLVLNVELIKFQQCATFNKVTPILGINPTGVCIQTLYLEMQELFFSPSGEQFELLFHQINL